MKKAIAKLMPLLIVFIFVFIFVLNPDLLSEIGEKGHGSLTMPDGHCDNETYSMHAKRCFCQYNGFNNYIILGSCETETDWFVYKGTDYETCCV